MKLLIIFFTLLSSNAFAEPMTELILGKTYGHGMYDDLIFSKVKISKRIYDLTKSGKRIEFICKYTHDKNVSFGVSNGQLYVKHKTNEQVAFCDTAVNCRTKEYSDLSHHDSLATDDVETGRDFYEKYSIESLASWQKRKERLADVGYVLWRDYNYEDMPEIEIYAPSKHGKKIPVNENGFHCAIPDAVNRIYLEP